MMRKSEMPADFMAERAHKFSPIFPKASSDASKLPGGKAMGTSVKME
jgi:hypothetical protein